MDRVFRLTWGFFLSCCLSLCAMASVFVSSTASATWPMNEGGAYAQCQEAATNYGLYYNAPLTCDLTGTGKAFATTLAQCPSGYWGMGTFTAENTRGTPLPNYFWCVKLNCQQGSDGGSWVAVSMGALKSADTDGCCLTHQQTGSGSYGSRSWVEGKDTLAGGNCRDPVGTGDGNAVNFPVCDGLSCYNPDSHMACYGTESGEQVCMNVGSGSSPGGCATGATGSVCVGTSGDGSDPAPPAPSDPPIPKGQAPDSTQHGSDDQTPSGGGNTTFIQNNYSGTSPGSGSSGSSGAEGGSTGSQSNANGSGNSGPKGTGQNGQCPDGKVPTASGCSGTYTDNGCDTPPQCYGDAVMCGNAKENHYTRCAVQKMAAASSSSSGLTVGDPSAALAAAGVPADGGASGDPSGSGLVTVSDLGGDGFDASGLGFSRSCPAPPSFTFRGQTFSIDTGPACDWASMFGYLVVLFAMLAGLRIVSTGKA